jgi:hypothetical protein
MRFQVPQFIEVESKIFGPLTFKQFIYLVGGAGVIFLLYVFLPFWLMVIPSLVVAGFSLALAFYKVNNRPFISIVENALKFFSSSRLYLWKKVQPNPKDLQDVKNPERQPEEIYIPKLTQGKLKDLAWSLDIKKENK